MKSYKAYIFDMDGTVLNTLDDLSDALNYALGACGHRHDLTAAETGMLFGSGVTVAVSRALAYEMGYPLMDLIQIGTEEDAISPLLDSSEISRIEEVYRPYYEAHCTDKTAPYPGIPEAVRRLRSAGILTAVVSNKPDGAVQMLVKDLLDGLFDFSLGEKKGVARKPAPDMVRSCFEALGVSAEEAVYIGDSEIDLETAARGGLDCIAVTWGFRSREFLKSLGAKTLIDSPDQL